MLIMTRSAPLKSRVNECLFCATGNTFGIHGFWTDGLHSKYCIYFLDLWIVDSGLLTVKAKNQCGITLKTTENKNFFLLEISTSKIVHRH